MTNCMSGSPLRSAPTLSRYSEPKSIKFGQKCNNMHKKRSVKKEINSVKNLAGKDIPKFVEIYPKPEHVATKNTLPTSPHNKTKEIREF